MNAFIALHYESVWIKSIRSNAFVKNATFTSVIYDDLILIAIFHIL